MKSVNSYLLKSVPKEIAEFIEVEKSIIGKAFKLRSNGGSEVHSMTLNFCVKKRIILTEKYGNFDSNGVML